MSLTLKRTFLGKGFPEPNIGQTFFAFISRSTLLSGSPSKQISSVTTKQIIYINSYKLDRSRYLPAYLKKIINPVLQRNAYFALPENILTSMLCDENAKVPDSAVQKILAARLRKEGKPPRIFKVPNINLNAKTYVQIDWNKVEITEPPLTSGMSETELRCVFQNKKNIPELNLPCHTQSVERCVKLVTDASMKVAGPDSRDGYIRATFLSRSEMPQFETKSHYVTHNDKFLK